MMVGTTRRKSGTNPIVSYLLFVYVVDNDEEMITMTQKKKGNIINK